MWNRPTSAVGGTGRQWATSSSITSTTSKSRFQTNSVVPKFGDVVREHGRTVTREELQSYSAYQKHQILLSSYKFFFSNSKNSRNADGSSASGVRKGLATTDYDILKEHHCFLRDDDVDAEENNSTPSWEVALAKRYYDRLFKEYVVCDLSRYETGQIGMRWRSEREVIQGKGQFVCGNRECVARNVSDGGLKTFELHFKYKEQGKDKEALVKVRLCPSCAYKLSYRNQSGVTAVVRKRRGSNTDEQKTRNRKKSKRRASSSDSDTDRGSTNDTADRQTCTRASVPQDRGTHEDIEGSRSVKAEPISSQSIPVKTDSGPTRDNRDGGGGRVTVKTEHGLTERNEDAIRAERSEEPKHLDPNELRELERRVWKTPSISEVANKSREEEFDEFLTDMFL